MKHFWYPLACFALILAPLRAMAGPSVWVGYDSAHTGYRITEEGEGYRIYSVGGKYLIGVPVAWNTKSVPTRYAYTLTLSQLQTYLGVQ